HAQAARIENLGIHARNVEDHLIRTEEDLALLEERAGPDRKRSGSDQAKWENPDDPVMGLISENSAVTPEVRGQLAEISDENPNLSFNSHTGVSKLDTDVLFDVGGTELKPGAEAVLAELVRVLNTPEGRDLNVLVVGHTDDRLIAKKPVREEYPNNFHLSARRALAVSDRLRKLGLASERMGVAGFGPHQPVAPNRTDEDRRKNRRVELFVMAADVPVIGWTETTPGLY
ncbi:MAG: OmpA family protein, partial [Planctomycetes bacterium]|nr:OmpA family protein [Planctomycetota bacterium]